MPESSHFLFFRLSAEINWKYMFNPSKFAGLALLNLLMLSKMEIVKLPPQEHMKSSR